MAQVTPSYDVLFSILVLVVVSVLVARRLGIPYTVPLVFAGLITPVFSVFPLPKISPEFFMILLLPPIIFEAATRTNLHHLRKDADVVLGFAFVGTLLSAVVIGIFTHFFLGFSLLNAFLLGVIVSPTDPVAVTTTFLKLGVPERLLLIIEGESLLNDGIVIVLYSAVVAAFTSNVFEPLKIAQGITFAVVIGVAIGGFLGYIIYRILRLSGDVFIDFLLTFIAMYGAYQLADILMASGVISVIFAGLVMAECARSKGVPQESTVTLALLWEFFAFLASSVAFIFVGMSLELQLLRMYLWIVLPTIFIVLISRLFMVYLISTVVYTWKKVIPGNWRDAIFWSGLRGPVSIVLVLSLRNLPIEHVQEITAISFGVVLFSILVQGLSLSMLIKKLGLVT